MKKKITLLLLFACQFAFAQTTQQLENIRAFNRLYGYVKYFHPSDEAAALDWDSFAVYGSKQVEQCKNASELQKKLVELFLPVAPSIKILKTDTSESFSLEEITPSDKSNYRVVTWQHKGLHDDREQSPYKSARLNRKFNVLPARKFGTIMSNVDIKPYRDKEFIFSASVKFFEGTGSGHLWARVDRDSQKPGFFENMNGRPIVLGEWKRYEIKGTVDSDANNLAIGCFLKDGGKLMVDDLKLVVRGETEWETLYSNSFETDASNAAPKSLISNSPLGFNTLVTDVQATEGEKSVLIEGIPEVKVQKPLFDKYCQVGEFMKKNIGAGLTVILPLALYGDENATYPKADEKLLMGLNAQLKNALLSDSKDLYVRIGDIIIVWNVFQHFYPYFDVTKANWSTAFTQAIGEAYTNQTNYDFLQTLRKFTAKLEDGHVRVNATWASTAENFALPIEWEWIEDKLVITKVLDDKLPLKAGDLVSTINNISALKYFVNIREYISAATPGWLNYRAQISSIVGPENSKVVITFLNEQNKKSEVALTRTLQLRRYYQQLDQPKNEPFRKLSDSIYYLDIGEISMDQIKSKLIDLGNAKSIICDLRGYPKENHQLISYLLQQNDTSKSWMQVPQIIYPDQENITGYSKSGWELRPNVPHLNAKVFFITDGRAISYAESYLSFIEHYKLATIIGQPSAGTNGNVNTIKLPGSIGISWTGMKVVKHDGSPHHGIGIIPNVYVQRTIKSVRENKDEFLDKAIELALRAE